MDVGTVIAGRYRVERVLGQGGMGLVVVARHTQLGQLVALKVMRDDVVHDAVGVERFQREAQTSARLKSEHVCRVFDVGMLPSGAPFLAMELLDGVDLAAMLKQRTLSIPEAIDYVLQAGEAIAEAHAQGIIHRDLKPSNLFAVRRLDGTLAIKVLDFGIAKAPSASDLALTGTSMVMGSPAYMSPEQLRSARDVDGRTDIWALGVILYQCTTGRLPFPASTITELTAKVLVDQPDPLRLEPRFDAVVMRCLEKDPARRYPTIAALAAELAAVAGPAAQQRAAGIAHFAAAPLGVAATQAVGHTTAGTAAPYQTAGTVGTPAPYQHAGAAHPHHTAAPHLVTTQPASRRNLAIAGVVGAIVLVSVIAAVSSSGGSAPAPPASTSGVTPTSTHVAALQSKFSAAIVQGRCDEARAIVKELVAIAPRYGNLEGTVESCQPAGKGVYPITYDGALKAMQEKHPDRALDIAVTLLEKTPDDWRLIQIAATAACVTRNEEAATLYVPKVKDTKRREGIASSCRQLGIEIH